MAPFFYGASHVEGAMSVTRTEYLYNLAKPLAESLGLELWGVETVGSVRPVARIYVDTKHADDADLEQAESFDTSTGVNVDQCAHLSRLLALSLDVEDAFATSWVLEVSSPGLERPFFSIDQLRDYVGKTIDVVMVEAHDDWNGRKKFTGNLESIRDEEFTVVPLARTVDDPESVTIAWHMVRRAHLVHVFAEKGQKRDAFGEKKKAAKKQRKQPKRSDAIE